MGKIRKSTIVAFWQLLRAIRENEDVFLLHSGDELATQAMNEYNDQVFSLEDDDPSRVTEGFKAYTDNLAAEFSSDTGQVDTRYELPTEAQLQQAAGILSAAIARK
jgi:hypothetical protein